MPRHGAAVDRYSAVSQGLAQSLSGELGRVFDAEQHLLPAVAQWDGSPKLCIQTAGNPVEADATLAAQGHGADAVFDTIKLQRRVQGQGRRLAHARAGTDAESDGVVVEAESGNGRAVIGLRIVHGPAGGIGFPNIPGVVRSE